MKNYGIVSFVVGLVGIYATIYIVRKAWEKGGEE
tara:strand:+ start:561 stop:662 length:102 start_codon:yes stop_codon:yes gene_type:complete